MIYLLTSVISAFYIVDKISDNSLRSYLRRFSCSVVLVLIDHRADVPIKLSLRRDFP